MHNPFNSNHKPLLAWHVIYIFSKTRADLQNAWRMYVRATDGKMIRSMVGEKPLRRWPFHIPGTKPCLVSAVPLLSRCCSCGHNSAALPCCMLVMSLNSEISGRPVNSFYSILGRRNSSVMAALSSAIMIRDTAGWSFRQWTRILHSAPLTTIWYQIGRGEERRSGRWVLDACCWRNLRRLEGCCDGLRHGQHFDCTNRQTLVGSELCAAQACQRDQPQEA